MIYAEFDQTFLGWRNLARQYMAQNVSPQEITWQENLSLQQTSLLVTTDKATDLSLEPRTNFSVPAEYISLAETLSYASDPQKWDLMYRLLYRLQFENKNLLKISVDNDVRYAELLTKSIHKDIHKMHAFVRFKKQVINNEDFYIAWHKPEHLIVKPATPFFARRFGDKKWSIYTPDESAHWDLKTLTFSAGMDQHDFQVKDDWDEVWTTYYKSTFNPARIKIKMMKAEMSPKYWSTMPETKVISELIREAPHRLQLMAQNQNHAALVDENKSLSELKLLSKSCKACPLALHATHTVFGEGAKNAKLMIVGEQPGDQEDLVGLPFVGPAGEVLNQALEKNGIKREEIYLTNAVKHFKWTTSTVRDKKIRLHKKPNGSEMHACKPWLEAEIKHVNPEVIVVLGSTAATAVLGRLPKISEERGQIIIQGERKIIISWHPSAILRATNEDEALKKTEQLIEDLKLAVATVS